MASVELDVYILSFIRDYLLNFLRIFSTLILIKVMIKQVLITSYAESGCAHLQLLKRLK
jgi:hypothetical protein